MWRFEGFLDWATPGELRRGFHALAAALRQDDTRSRCLVRRQGRCPGLQFCPDCSWSEGTSRDGG